MFTDISLRLQEAIMALENGVIQVADVLGAYGEEIYNIIVGLG